MKNYLTSILSLSLISLFLSSCMLQPIGKCTYGKDPALKGKLVIRSIQKKSEGSKTYICVSVEGFFKRDFFYTPEEFERCFTSKGYSSGSEVTGIVVSGGPCPPMYSIEDCNQ